ncbi:MAG: hemolysin family protein [Nostocoides sp.]
MQTTLILLAIVALALTFLFAAVEESVSRVSRAHAQGMADEGLRGSRRLLEVLDDSAAHLSVITFLRVTSEQAATVFLTFAIVAIVHGTWSALGLAVAVLVVISFVLVGVSPRTLGRQHADSLARLSAPSVIWLRRLLGPLARLLVTIGNAVTPGRGYRDGPFETESELRDLVDFAGDTEVIEDDEREMIHSVFELGDTLAREVMVPRTDMVTIDHDRTVRHAMNLFLRLGFSRIPVVGEGSDDILGLLYFKDVVRRTNADQAASALSVTELMRPMPFVPESKPVDDLLREMQGAQIHFAVVVDEYGGTAGVVTIEDILEEIVGEIADEYDRETPEAEELPDGTWRVDASMDIDDLADLFDVAIEEDEVSTVGGLITKVIGRVPILGSQAQVAGLTLTAERMAGRRHRIATVLVEREAQQQEEDQPGIEVSR